MGLFDLISEYIINVRDRLSRPQSLDYWLKGPDIRFDVDSWIHVANSLGHYYQDNINNFDEHKTALSCVYLTSIFFGVKLMQSFFDLSPQLVRDYCRLVLEKLLLPVHYDYFFGRRSNFNGFFQSSVYKSFIKKVNSLDC